MTELNGNATTVGVSGLNANPTRSVQYGVSIQDYRPTADAATATITASSDFARRPVATRKPQRSGGVSSKVSPRREARRRHRA
jgi:hypothetical protein